MGRRRILLALSGVGLAALLVILVRFRKPPEPGPVQNLLKADRWNLAEVRADAGMTLIRYRTPVLSGADVRGYGSVLMIVWRYSESGSGALPSDAQSARMKVFEDRFCSAVERDAHAVLAAVRTFDGTRQWVFYTRDVQECAARLHAMPQEAEPYPIGLTYDSDPEWHYLREKILKQVPPQKQD